MFSSMFHPKEDEALDNLEPTSKKSHFDVSEKECYTMLFWLGILIASASMIAAFAVSRAAYEAAMLCHALIVLASGLLVFFAIDHMRSPYINGAMCPLKLDVHYTLMSLRNTHN